MPDPRVVELTIPALLAFRDFALRAVMECCKLVGRDVAGDSAEAKAVAGAGSGTGSTSMPDERFDLHDAFMAEFVSAFSEIYNNIPIHAYHGTNEGTVALTIHIGKDHISADIIDTGKSFDIDSVPLPDALPTGGMGIHIARSMLDELVYEPGPPNLWRLTKYVRSPHEPSKASPSATE